MSGDFASLIALAVGFAVFVSLSNLLFPKRRRGRRKAGASGRAARRPGVAAMAKPRGEPNGPSGNNGPRSPAEQLECVMGAAFSAQTLLSAREAKVAAAAERLLSELAPNWCLCPQVALGEVLRAKDQSAYWAVNAKRCDMLIVDETWRPIAALEYQGAGHHQGKAAARDAVKKEALRRAGVGWIEVSEGDRPEDLRAAVTKLIRERGLQTAA